MAKVNERYLSVQDIRDLVSASSALNPGGFKLAHVPFVDGIEATQAIQYYQSQRHLSDANDHGADNSVRLIANKPAWVRVYVRTGLFGVDTTVTGELVIERRSDPFPFWQGVTTLTPQAPGTVLTQSDPDYATERSTLGSTLNFIVPQDQMWGYLRLTARIWAQGGTSESPLHARSADIDATLQQTLRLRGIMISYNGPDPTVNQANPPNINLPAPTVANLQATAAWTLTTNPLQSTGLFSSAGTLAWSTPLTGMATSPGACSTQWVALNAAVAQVKANDGNRTDVIYYGLLPAGTPIANVGGCESSGVSTGPDTRQVTMAHEVGHGAGLAHAPCGTPGDANYPAYEPYDPVNSPTASIGEYGLDINDGAIHPPTDKDYMSYCGNRWMSLYHHGRLLNSSKFDPRLVGVTRWQPPLLADLYLWPWEILHDPPRWEHSMETLRVKAQALISVIGIVDEVGQFDVQSVMRVTALPTVHGGVRTDFVAELLGSAGDVVARALVMRLPSHGAADCGCDGDDVGPFAFQALVPSVEPGTILRVIRRQEGGKDIEAVWERKAPEREPVIRRFSVRAIKGVGTATWQTDGRDASDLEFSIQFSKDRGRSWNNLGVRLQGRRWVFPLTLVPSGSLQFRLQAHDGFFSTDSVPRTVRVPSRPPEISILYPEDGRILAAGSPMRFWGAVTQASGKLVKAEMCSWSLDGKEVGAGTEVWTTAPKSGLHECTLTVVTREGKSQALAKFRTARPDRILEEYASSSKSASSKKPRKKRMIKKRPKSRK